MTDIPYFDGLMGEEQREITDSIRLLLRQTFILERKYDRRTGRFQYNREFRICNKHLEFIRTYFPSAAYRFMRTASLVSFIFRERRLWGISCPGLPPCIF